ncbi:protein kinase IME2 [Saccharomyces eubayanus]|uniref:protein kinase IME2 n=1 Tax=Saccharomyces eubayanus TaxID=1080349 RepID=UPI0006C6795B|nr:IME2-like protein [Saccharomyces eubayanus]KOG98504.1 IME2-like protein [Saccharomyces eubayanus]
MVEKRCRQSSSSGSEFSIPPDVDNPPLSIPLKTLSDRYQLIEKLGAGSFGCVTLAKAQFSLSNILGRQQQDLRGTLMDQPKNGHHNYITKTQGVVAIKTMMTKLHTLQDYTRVREIKFILAIPANDHLIQIFEVFIDSENYQLHIVMECMEQNLYQMMKHRGRRVFSIPSLKSILSQILAGLKHIHQENFFHRDLKPENILITPSTQYFDKEYMNQIGYQDNYVIKLADFGLARHVENKNPYTAYVSTRWYRSPEILLRSGYYSKPLDIWAFGCVAVEVTVFRALFPGANEIDQIWKILEVLGTPIKSPDFANTNHIITPPPGGFWDDASKLVHKLNLKLPDVEGSSLDHLLSSSQLSDLSDVVKKCLRWDPNERATAQELCEMPFFENTVASQVETRTDTTNTEQALIFAGINPLAAKNTKPLYFNSSTKVPVETESHDFDINHNDNNSQTVCTPNLNQEKLTLVEFLNEFVEEDNDDHSIPDVDTDSTISDSIDETDLSKEIRNNLALCQLPDEEVLENSLSNIRQLTNDIEIINKDEADNMEQLFFDLEIPEQDEFHKKQPFNEHTDFDEDIVLPFVNDSNYTHTEKPYQKGSNFLGNASLGDSFNSMPDFTPRNFLIPTLDKSQEKFESHLSNQNQHFGNITF